ncbi:MAG TPA: hypothetical protein VFD59_00235 [Nocardioidaceae bacterium]|nr:hypothetical protein [Nocardioidaceae bacterium]
MILPSESAGMCLDQIAHLPDAGAEGRHGVLTAHLADSTGGWRRSASHPR